MAQSWRNQIYRPLDHEVEPAISLSTKSVKDFLKGLYLLTSAVDT